MNVIKRSYFLLHLSVFLWGFTAILGDLISLSAVVLVWWRVALTSIFLIFWPGLIKQLRGIKRVQLIRFALVGFLVALHWLCFYGSIKLANASVALITMSTTAFFTAFIEPLVNKSSLDKIDIGLSVLIVPAMILTTIDLSGGMIIGFWLGILAAFLIAIFAVFNKCMINEASAEVITFIEMTSSCLFLSICSPVIFMIYGDLHLLPTHLDIVYLLILSVFCTLLPFIMNLSALRHLSAFVSNLVINLEPIYGILLAIIILGDHKELSMRFYGGVLLVIVIVMAHPILKHRN